jgi:hypothetical protein
MSSHLAIDSVMDRNNRRQDISVENLQAGHSLQASRSLQAGHSLLSSRGTT